MLYREVGQFKTSYQADQAIFPIAQDRWFILAGLVLALGVVPIFINDYFANAVFLPFLIYALAAIGLNILTGYCGQLSLGTGAAYASYKLMTAFPELNIVVVFVLSGVVTAAVGMMFGLPSLRIKGFYLAVATLAAQFFIIWLFYRVPWFFNYNATGQISAPPREIFGVLVMGPRAHPAAAYVFTLVFVAVFALIAKNLVRGRAGRSWMAIRDMDISCSPSGFRRSTSAWPAR
jgi:branched-chain amino acid transport system permease protein